MVLAAARKRRHDEVEATREHVASALAGILPGAHRSEHQPHTIDFGGGKFRRRDGGPIGGTAKVLRSGNIEWDIRTDGELNGLALAELVAKTARNAR